MLLKHPPFLFSMSKGFILFLMLMCFTSPTDAQERKTVTINLPAPAKQKEVFEEYTNKAGVKNGSYKRYRNKKLVESGYYKDGLKDSSWSIYTRKGQCMARGNYQGDSLVGQWQYFTYRGTLFQTYDHDKDSLLYFNLEEARKTGNAPKVFPDTASEQLPLFIGGTAYMNTLIENNMIYPREAWKKSLNAQLTIRFVVDKKGNTTSVQSLKKAGYGFDEEGIRLVNLFGKAWIPAKQKGKKVSVMFNLPINFVLE